MVDTLEIPRRQGWLFGAVGGALVGAADALSVWTSAGLGIGLVGGAALILAGVLVGGLLGAAGGGLVGLWSALRRHAAGSAWLGGAVVLAARGALQGGAWALPVACAWVAVGLAGAWYAGRRARIGVALGVVGAAGLVGWIGTGRPETAPAHASDPDRPNVLLVTLAGVRLDHLGEHPIDTPALDGLAQEGTRFALAVAQSSDTLASARTVHASRPPWAEPGEATLADALGSAGYTTGAFLGSSSLARGTGLEHGFAVYDDEMSWPKGFSLGLAGRLAAAWTGRAEPDERRASEVVERATRWIGAQPGRWFAWVHLHDAVAPYEPSVPFDERYYRGADPRGPQHTSLPGDAALHDGHGSSLRGVTDAAYVEARYQGEVASLDAALAPLLTSVASGPQAASTLVIVVGLHGEVMRDGARWFGHEGELVEPVVHVPWVMRQPGRVPVGHTVRAPVELTDLAPTVLDLVGVAAGMESAQGVSLRATWEERGVARRFARAVGVGERRPAAARLPGALIVHDPSGASRAWRFPAEVGPQELWTEARLLDLVGHLVPLEGDGAPPPPALDEPTRALLRVLQPGVSEPLGAGFAD